MRKEENEDVGWENGRGRKKTRKKEWGGGK